MRVASTVVAVTDTVHLHLRAPTVADGPVLWRMAADSATLDVNSPYAYLLWCRDFAATSVITHLDDRPAGFVTGYRRPDQPTTVMVWQVAVEAGHRGAGIGGRMLDHLARRLQPDGVTHVEASVMPDNEASQRLFCSFARRWRLRSSVASCSAPNFPRCSRARAAVPYRSVADEHEGRSRIGPEWQPVWGPVETRRGLSVT